MNINSKRFKTRAVNSIATITNILGDSVDKIYVFGSLARNEGKLSSDIDLMVSMKKDYPDKDTRFKLYDEVCDHDDSDLTVDIKFCVRDNIDTYSKAFNEKVSKEKVLIWERGNILL